MLPPTIHDVRPLSKSAMKLLVLAQIPPPLHGQSLMVRTMVEGLPAHGIALHHVPLNLSRDHADIGRWRPGKVFTVLAACFRAVAARFSQHCDTLYYVPAPGKRGALYRDWVVMLLCRPFFRQLVLHFHNGGLGDWLATQATGPERGLTRLLLGRANLALVLSESLCADAAALSARRIAVVPNGIADPCPDWTPRPAGHEAVFQVLFLGLGSEDKGLFAAAEAVLAANRQLAANQLRLVVAGAFPDAATQSRFQALLQSHPEVIHHAGFVTGAGKAELLRTSNCLCLPTRYAHEAQPLVLLEALAHDLHIVATDWRGIAATLPAGTPLVPPGDTAALAGALLALHAKDDTPAGEARRYFLSHFTAEQHLATLAAELRRM
jgi:glycosyltransferase involved in cell wall biosynthesis